MMMIVIIVIIICIPTQFVSLDHGRRSVGGQGDMSSLLFEVEVYTIQPVVNPI